MTQFCDRRFSHPDQNRRGSIMRPILIGGRTYGVERSPCCTTILMATRGRLQRRLEKSVSILCFELTAIIPADFSSTRGTQTMAR
jgi:hypothetical protein